MSKDRETLLNVTGKPSEDEHHRACCFIRIKKIYNDTHSNVQDCCWCNLREKTNPTLGQ